MCAVVMLLGPHLAFLLLQNRRELFVVTLHIVSCVGELFPRWIMFEKRTSYIEMASYVPRVMKIPR